MSSGAMSLPMVFLWQVSDDNPQQVAGPVSTSVYSPWRNRWPCTSLLWVIIHMQEWLQTSCIYYTCKPTFIGRALYQDLLKVHWFAVNNFHQGDVVYIKNDISEIFKNLFTVRNIHQDDTLMNLVRISRKQIKVVYSICLFCLVKKSNDQ